MKKQAIAFVTMAVTVFTLSAGAFSQTPDQGPSKPLGTGAIPKHVAGTRISGASAKPASVLATDLGARLTPEITSTYRFITDWSQDGKLITYGQNGDIYIVPAAGGEPVNITNVTSGECFAPSFTPDSASIVFTWWDGLNNTSYEVDAINISTRKVTVLYDLAALGVMSRDGKYLVFRSLAGDLCVYDTTKYSLNVINSGDQAYGYIAISPDNSTIVTTMNTSDGDKRLFSIPLLGGAPKQLTFHAGEHEYPEFSPDGKWVLYTNWDNATTTSQIQALDLSTGTSKYIWDTAVDAWCASFAPGGKRFAYLLYNEDNKAYDLYAADFPYAAALAALRVVSPNGGEQWPAGSTQMIKWEGPATAKVEYSTDNGSTWIVLPDPATTLANRYEWVVPNTLSTKCLVKVSTLSGDASDKSDAVFSIVSASASSLTLTSPNGGEFFKAGSVQFIKWQASGVTKVRIDYSIDGGTTWTAITAGADATTGMFSWTLPNVSSTKCLVRITDTSNTTLMSKSAGTFEISKPSITVTAPNGGDVWTAGTQQKITWGAGGVDSFNIEYTTDGGTTWMKIAGPVPAADTNAFDWTVPATPSEKCFVRVSDANNSAINDVSDIAFAIKLPASVTVTAPNGGEKLVPGKTVAIAWTFTGLTELYLEYSPDGGANWKEIAGGVKAADGSYAWVIPDINSTNCLVRVSNSYDMSVRDQSDAVFTIAPAGVATITVTSPNAGEIWQAGTVQNITWTSTAVVNVKIEYSTNNGSSWVNIIATIPANAGTFAWTIPTAINSTNCRVRVTATANSAVTDASDGVFSIFPASNMPKVTVVSPNSGGKYVAGDYLTIIWTATNVKTVNIRYSIDGGAGYQWVAQNVDATKGQYTWILPSVTAEYCKIWIYDSSNLDVGDTSDGTFSIVIPAAHSIKVLSPNGGEQFTTGSVQTISWSAEGIAVYLVEVSIDGGTTWTTLPASAIDGSAMTCKWTTPATASPRCLVRVSDANDATVSDTSDAAFSVTLATETPKITVIVPNGGERWTSGSSQRIKWNSSGGKAVKIEYTTDGSTWSVIESSLGSGDGLLWYDWTLPSAVSSQTCRIRITETSNTSITDMSDADFTISQPSKLVMVKIPAGSFQMGGVGVEHTSPSAEPVHKVTLSAFEMGQTEITQSQFMKIMGFNPSQFKGDDDRPVENMSWYEAVQFCNKLSEASSLEPCYNLTTWVCDYSKNGYRLPTEAEWEYACRAGTTTLYNSGDTEADLAKVAWYVNNSGGTTQPVGRRAANAWGLFDIHGNVWELCNDRASNYSAGDNTDPVGPESGENRIFRGGAWDSLTDAGSPVRHNFKPADKASVVGFRVARGSFTPGGVSISVISPNGGESWVPGTVKNITWTSSGVTSVKIDYTVNDGSTWASVVSSTAASTGSFSWTIPSTINSTNCRIRISDAGNSAAVDASDAVFTIAPAAVTKIAVTIPNGGEIWQAGSSQTIKWTSTGVSLANVEFSQNGGQTWTMVGENVNSATGTGSYPFTAPSGLVSSNCLVRVTDTKNANVSDVSDTPFTVEPAPFIKITSPAGGETWGAGTVNPITFKAFGVKTLKFEYSTDNRTTWNVIADKVDITTLKVISSAASVNSVPEYSFSWTLPNLAAKSDLCFVRVVDTDDVTHIDRNPNAFTISPNVAITLTRPVGGETLYAGTKSPVTWTASAAVSTVDIFYSTDSGGSWTAVATAVGASAGTYAWVVPAVNSVTCRVRVIDTATKAASSSLRDFTIKKPSITVLSPNGGETIVSGSRTTITWKAEGVDRVSISYSTDGGSTSTVIEPDIDASTGSYSWTVPSVSSSNCRVIVKSTTLASLSDTSDAAFTIQSNAWITLLDPNGGEKFYAGQTVTIRWRSQNVSKVSMAFSVDTAGKEYTIIAENVDASSGSFEWVVPGVYTPTGLIVIWDSSNTDVYDGCDAFFTTLQPSITLKYPNGGETFTTGDKVNIQWESVGLGTIEIIYSTDNFSTNQYISPGTDATRGSYEWIVPDINSSTVLIAIGTSYFDISDNFFTVRKGTKPYLQLTAPNGGQIWQAGSSQTISWTASNSSSLKIDYSTDGGVSWNLVAGGVNSSLQSYSWTVPGAPSQNCKVRITDLSDATVSDASDGLFTIVESTTAFISVSTPGTGDRLTVGSKREIKWNTSGVSNVKIEFSIDNGTTWETVVESVSAAGGSYQWTVPDKKSNKCLIRVSDTTKPLVTGSSGMFEIMQPEIMIAHTPITQAKENDKITFTAEVTGVTSPVVELKYDVTGRRVFDKTKVMTKVSGNTYSCFLDVGVFTAEGMEYAIVARDPDNVSIRTTSPDQGYYCVRAEVTEMTSPYSVTGGSLQNAYRMVSIPLQLNKKTITEQITRLPDGAMGTEWRLFRFSPGENDPKEYPNIEGFAPGIAFWLISTSSFQLKTPDGVAVTTSENFTIELKPGWNDIANPWMFDISWNDIENPSSANISKPYAYEGSWSDPTSAGSRILKPWTGYAVKNMESRNVIIRLVPKKAVSAQKEALLDGDLVWSLSLSARAGLASDIANGFGVRRSASPAWDDNDHVEPPAIGQYVTVTFPHRDWTRYPSDYTVDFRPPGGDLSWDFDVRTNIAHERVTVAVDGLAELPSGVSVSVIDRDTGKAVQCADGSFTFMSGEGLTERRFTLKTTGVEGPGRDTDARPAAFVTTRAYPNPFNPRTIIRYELSEPGYVVLSVFNTVGQLVRQEHLGRRERGVHEYVFDAARLTSGLYVYRVDAGFSSATDKMLFMK